MGSEGVAVTTMLGASAWHAELLRTVELWARASGTVLITGPTGTGKELVARMIHEQSARADGPYVICNCGTLSAALARSELFGHERGSFTGAMERYRGAFERAHGGTLFLDEIGEMDAVVQSMLLRAVESGAISTVGAKAESVVDVRIVAATNRDLEKEVFGKRFREDLYYRLNVFPIHTKALADRHEDIPILVRHFIADAARRVGIGAPSIDEAAMERLINYRWPGNVRELKHMMERLVACSEGFVISERLLPFEVSRDVRDGLRVDEEVSIVTHIRGIEEEAIRRALDKFHWNKTKAAAHLGMTRQTLQSKVKKLKLAG